MKFDSKLRCVNAVLIALLVVLLLLHALLGSISRITGMPHALAWLSWVFAGLVVVHVGMCVATSRFMLTDTLRPPSKKKRRHLWLKWASGIVLAACVLVHVFCSGVSQLASMLVPLAVLTWHSYVGVKSLVRDLGWNKSLQKPLRAGLFVAALVIALVACAGGLG